MRQLLRLDDINRSVGRLECPRYKIEVLWHFEVLYDWKVEGEKMKRVEEERGGVGAAGNQQGHAVNVLGILGTNPNPA